MSTKHQLKICIETPENVVVEKLIWTKYTVTNITENEFVGGDIDFVLSWASLGDRIFVPHVLKVPVLEAGETHKQEFDGIHLIDDMIMIAKVDKVSKAKDGKTIEVFNEKGGRVLGSIIV